MKRIYVDFNSDCGDDELSVNLGWPYNEEIDSETLEVGQKVIVYDEEIECDGTLIRGHRTPWGVRYDRSTVRSVR